MRWVALALVLASTPAHADRGEPWDGGTVGVQAGYGVLGTAGGAAAGLAVGGMLGLLAPRRDLQPVAVTAVLGAGIGALIGTVYGVHRGGTDRDGTGSVLGTSIGLGGGVLGIAGFELVARRTRTRLHPVIRIATYTGFLVAGSIVGYHASAGASPQPTAIIGVAF